MKPTGSHYSVVARRAELMAELFFQDLEPVSIARPPHDFGYDFLVVFKNSKGGKNTFGVEVKATDHPVQSPFTVDRRTYDLLAHSTLPGFLLVADVKQNRLFYAWPPRVDTRHDGSKSVRMTLTPIDSNTKAELHKSLLA